MSNRAKFAAIFLVWVLSFSDLHALDQGKKATIKGHLIDLLCAEERSSEGNLGDKHTKKCLQMPVCDEGGFGVLTADNEVIKFDSQGNDAARKLIAATDLDSDWNVKVSGRLLDGTMSVRKIKITDPPKKKHPAQKAFAPAH